MCFDNQCILDANADNRNCALTADGGLDMDAGAAGVIVNFPRAWKDTWTVGGGARYALGDRGGVAVAGVAYDTSAVPDQTLDPALMDMNKATGTLGISWPVTDALQLTGQLSHVLYFERTVDPRQRDANGDVMDAPAAPSRSPDAAGRYSQSITFAIIGAETRF